MLNISFRKQVLAGFIISLLLVFSVFYFSYTSINSLKKSESAIDHSEAVITTANEVQRLLLDGETGQRGYIATGKEKFLEPYNLSVYRVPAILTELKVLVGDNTVQIHQLDSLSNFANLKISELRNVIEIAHIKGFDTARKELGVARGKYYMDKVRSYVARLIKEETRTLNIKKASSDSAASSTLTAIIIGGLVVVFVVFVLFFYIQTTFLKLSTSEENIRTTNVELENVLAENREKNWLLTGTGLLNEKMQGQQSEKELAENILSEICSYTNALTGTFYLYQDEEQVISLYAAHAFSDLRLLKNTIKLAEGWVGQVVKDRKPAIVRGKLHDKLELASSVINKPLTECFIVPFFFDKKLIGVMEIAFAYQISESKKDYILMVADDIGIAINTAQARTKMQNLLEQVQQQAEELEAQQEEMRLTNEELLTKTEMLQESEEELKVQQEELRSTNVELEEKATLLEERNKAIEEARRAIAIKASELETTGRYKSEFLANMSHELRTPLNSILVLAQVLQDNKSANLTNDQVKYASVIVNAGNDLLTLINDILDLSKIESGKLDMNYGVTPIADILDDMDMLFAGIAAKKKIKFTFNTDKGIPDAIVTDKVRIEQILKNLLSNAFKFTDNNGAITVNVLQGMHDTISFCVKDTGIGIPADKLQVIFEAFQQADGSTSRKYGGTGLGLPISRELVNLLGGKITVVSEPGTGSEFTLTIPIKADTSQQVESEELTGQPTLQQQLPLVPSAEIQRKDNRDPLVMIVEDDKNFAGILEDYARQYNYDSVILSEGTHAVETIREQQPDAVILDINLPGKDGWQILKELKQNKETANIPVHLMSAGDAAANRIQREGAISFIKKPTDTQALEKLFTEMAAQSGTVFKKVLLIEDDKTQSQAIFELMKNQGIDVDQAYDGGSALNMLDQNEYHCVILDFNLPDISGLDLLDQIKENARFKNLPVIINTAMELDKNAVTRLMRYANAMVIKTNKSPNRLIDEVNLFLNKINQNNKRKETSVVQAKRNGIQVNDSIKGKKILLVDDDIRNIFALSSALKNYGMEIEIANNGLEAITKLEQVNNIDMVLMDIMMPEMDGYEAMQHIRKQNKWLKLPIIALTAKAMLDDREKCIDAGANDYITKPVDIDRLVSLMQLWMGN